MAKTRNENRQDSQDSQDFQFTKLEAHPLPSPCMPKERETKLGGATATSGFVDALGRGRVLGQFICRAARAGNKFTAAVRAYAFQNGLDTGRTEGAFVGTDAGFRGLWREIFVAAFAVGA